jgi:hypothetical protein
MLNICQNVDLRYGSRIARFELNKIRSARIQYGAIIFSILCFAAAVPAVAQSQTNSIALSESNSLWRAGVGQGFTKGVFGLDVSGGAGFGVRMLGTSEIHDWWLTAAQFGYVLSDVVGKDHFYRGNFELLGQLFGGEQYHPSRAYLVGLGPMLRYDFATGTRVVPFFDVSAGVTATDIRNGDLSSTFEFNLQAGVGAHVFLTDCFALTGQCRLIHISDADITSPNNGVNNVTFLLGATWFF